MLDDILSQETNELDETDVPLDSGKSLRVRSETPFAYSPLDDAESLAGLMAKQGVALTRDQIAALVDTVPTNSAFVGRLSACRLFGLVQREGAQYALTELAYRILDDDDAVKDSARAEAFLRPELYQKLVDYFRGKPVPGREGLNNVIEKFGVSARQKDRARQIFERSALFAGFLNQARDRLVAPIIAPSTQSSIKESPRAEKEKPEDSQTNPWDQKLIRGILELLPAPGDRWQATDRARWLRHLSHSLAALYDPEDDTEIKITVVKQAKEGE